MTNKKIVAIVLTIVLALTTCFVLTACSDDPTDPDNPNSGSTSTGTGSGGDSTPSTPIPHEITVEAPLGIEIDCDTISATKGVSVEVSVTPKIWMDVTAVKFNGTPCTKNSDGTYSFVMPDEDVTITAEGVDNGKTANSDRNLTWINVPTTITVGQWRPYYEIDFAQAIPKRTDGNGRLIDIEILFTNESVMNMDCIEFYSMENIAYISDFSLTFDGSKIKAGTTRMIIRQKSTGDEISALITVNPAQQ